MSNERISVLAARISVALDRIETASAAKPAVQTDEHVARLQDRHAALRKEALTAMAAIDSLISRPWGQGQ